MMNCFAINLKRILYLTTLQILLQSMQVSAMTLQEYIARYNPDDAERITYAIYDASRRHDVDPLLLASLMHIESTYNQNAVSPAGAIGIAQLMPGTAKDLGVNPYDMIDNINGGASYLSQMLDITDQYGISGQYALAAYNAGPGSLDTGIPSESIQYMQDVESEYAHLRYLIHGIPYYESPVRFPKRLEPQKQVPTKRERLLAAIRTLQRERKAERLKPTTVEQNSSDHIQNSRQKKKQKSSGIFF